MASVKDRQQVDDDIERKCTDKAYPTRVHLGNNIIEHKIIRKCIASYSSEIYELTIFL
jgi:hypothetical protein